MQKFLIESRSILDSRVRISGQDAKHISKILRMKKGDAIHLTDGNGTDYSATISEISFTQVDLEIVDKKISTTESPIKIRVCSGMLKHQKMDEVIKNLTQLGIYEWVPFFCERSIPTPDAKSIRKNLDRWNTIAKESVKQCRRSRLPDILPPVDFSGLLRLTVSSDIKIAFWEGAVRPLKGIEASSPIPIVSILIGPEGGFSTHEIDMAEAHGFGSYSLGPRILRAENASVVASALVQHLLGDM